MDIFLIRHADALPIGEGATATDEERPLSDAGKAQCKMLAGALQRRGVQFSTMLTSPLVRAKQTAEELLKHWTGPAPALEECAELAPGGRSKRLARAVRDLGAEAVALVGHQPDLGEHVAWLVGSKQAQIDLAKAGVAAVRCSEGTGKGEGMLVWLVTPEWF